MFRSFFILLFLFSFIVPATLFAATISAGIPTELIWFSKDPFVEGDQITIFTPLYNRSTYRFQGMLTLRDGNVTLGVKQFALGPGGTSEIFAFPWVVTRGEHSFSVLISGGEFVSSGKNAVDLPISEVTAQAVKRFVEPKLAVVVPASSSTTDKTVSEETPITDYLSSKVPASLERDALPVVGRIENFRLDQAARADTMVNNTLAGIPLSTTTPSDINAWGVFREGVIKGDIIHTPWGYVQLFLVLCYQFLTANLYAFYIFCSYVI
jgi:hypothetical protein